MDCSLASLRVSQVESDDAAWVLELLVAVCAAVRHGVAVGHLVRVGDHAHHERDNAGCFKDHNHIFTFSR